jgi:hypothetical protein
MSVVDGPRCGGMATAGAAGAPEAQDHEPETNR